MPRAPSARYNSRRGDGRRGRGIRSRTRIGSWSRRGDGGPIAIAGTPVSDEDDARHPNGRIGRIWRDDRGRAGEGDFEAVSAVMPRPARLVHDTLSRTPPGNGGWTVPVDPLLNAAAHPEPGGPVLAILRNRAA